MMQRDDAAVTDEVPRDWVDEEPAAEVQKEEELGAEEDDARVGPATVPWPLADARVSRIARNPERIGKELAGAKGRR